MRLALVALAVVAFLAVSAGLARVLSAAAAERNAAIGVIEAQAGGQGDRVVAMIVGCRPSPACREAAARRTERLRRPGELRVLRIDGPSRLALSDRVGTARVAWSAAAGETIVQCVSLRRRGDVLGGFAVDVLGLGDPVPLEGGCAAGEGAPS